MKKEHLILIAVGIVFLCVIAKKSSKSSPLTIKPGDKGNEVAGLQNALTSITGLQFSNIGAYDTDTLNAVKYYLQDTPALIDYEKGYVCKDFASSLYMIEGKVKT